MATESVAEKGNIKSDLNRKAIRERETVLHISNSPSSKRQAF